MTLALKPRAISVAFGVVSFFMLDGDRIIRVDVSRELLARIDSPPPDSKEGYIKRLKRHRRQLARIATAKYNEGQYEPEVRVLVVRIAADDMI
jgi:hypothetical protein